MSILKRFRITNFSYSWSPLSYFTVVMIVVWFPLAKILPPQIGWENGFLENLQVVVLALGQFACIYTYIKHRTKVSLGVASLMGLAIGRELSWGRVFRPTGLYNAEGPLFFDYPPAAHLAIQILVAIWVMLTLWLLLTNIHWEQVWQVKFPLIPFLLMAACTLIQYTAEHNPKTLFSLNEPQWQIVEEEMELLIYLNFIVFIYRYMFAVQKLLVRTSKLNVFCHNPYSDSKA